MVDDTSRKGCYVRNGHMNLHPLHQLVDVQLVFLQQNRVNWSSCTLSMSCLVGVLANTPGGVKRSGLGAHAVGFLVVY